MMRFINFTAVVAVVLAVTCCGSSKKTIQTVNASVNPFGPVFEPPVAEHDTDEYFGATGIAYGAANRLDVLQRAALTNAQSMIRQKVQHSYTGAIEDYSSYIGTNAGSDIKNKIEHGGRQLIDAMINETQVTKGPSFSEIDEKGNMTCYVGIRISKEKIAEAITDYVSESKELNISVDKEKFHKRLEDALRDYTENGRR